MNTPTTRGDNPLVGITDAQLIEYERQVRQLKGQTDLYWLTTEVLGYKDLGELHRPLCQLIESVNPMVWYLSGNSKFENIEQAKEASRKIIRSIEIPEAYKEFFSTTDNLNARLFLLFRGSFKTTIVSIAHTIQLMLIWPDIRILISSHKKEGGSQEILGAIKRHFMGNDVFRQLYKEWCPVAGNSGIIEWGTTEKVTLPNRSKRAVYPEATIEIAGVTTDVTGRHYNYIKADDLVTRDSVTNEIMLEKTEQYNSLLKFLFDQPEHGIIDYSGTCYHFADLYSVIRDDKSISSVIMPVVRKDGEPTFPERFTRDGIEKLRLDSSMSSYVWSCQYMLNPVAEDDQVFRPEWFKRDGFYFKEPPESLYHYILVDPANKQRKTSDYTAIMHLGVDVNHEIYVLDIIRDKLDDSGRVKAVFELSKKAGVHKVYYESIGFQATDAYNLRRYSEAQGFFISVEEIKASRTSKEDRIRGLQFLFESALIHMPERYEYFVKYERKSVNMVEVFKKEAFMFPYCEHDDMLDCLSFILDIRTRPTSAPKVSNPQDKFMAMRQLIIDTKNPRASAKYPQKKFNRFEVPYKKSPF